MKFLGIVNYGQDFGEPFFGVACDGTNIFSGGITGDINDMYNWITEFDITDPKEFERLQELIIDPIDWREACRRKLEWFIQLSAGKTSYVWKGESLDLTFHLTPIMLQLTQEVSDPRW